MRRSLPRITQPSTRTFMSASTPPCKKLNNPTTTTAPNLQKGFIHSPEIQAAPLPPSRRSPYQNPDGGSPLRPPPPRVPAATGSREVDSDFGELGLNEELVTACEEMGMIVPRCMGIPEILKGSSLVMSTRSGYSRTLAYLLPLLQEEGLIVVMWEIRNVLRALRLACFSEHTKRSSGRLRKGMLPSPM